MDQTTVMATRVLGVAFGAGFSYAMINLVVQDRLQLYVSAAKFQLLVLSTGILLAGMVLLKIRRLMQIAPGHAHHHHHHHSHDPHAAEHGHDHGHHHHGGDQDHSHGHDHGHGPTPWRLIVLAFPLLIIFTSTAPQFTDDYILNLQPTALKEAAQKIAGLDLPELTESELKTYVDAKPTPADWKEIDKGKMDPNSRAAWENLKRPIVVAGQFIPTATEGRYQLQVLKMTCCASDAQPMALNVVGATGQWRQAQWVEVTGILNYAKVEDPQRGITSYFPVVRQLAVRPTQRRPYIQ